MDILAISCDSFNEDVNVLIGRGQGKLNHVENLQKLRGWCRDYKVAFKINSVINRFNVDEDMRAQIRALNPIRWKASARRCSCRLQRKTRRGRGAWPPEVKRDKSPGSAGPVRPAGGWFRRFLSSVES